MRKYFSNFVTAFLFISMTGFVLNSAVYPQTNAFTFQGSLNDGGQPANGSYDFEFALFDAVSGGNQIGSTVIKSNVDVADGVFSAVLNFGSGFTGESRYLEIRVRIGARLSPEGSSYTTLSPRQPVNSAPYAIRSINAANAVNAENAGQLGGFTAGQFVLTNDSRLSDARQPTAGSPNYIQNVTTLQNSSNFHISGTGKADVFDVATQYNLGQNRILSIPGTDNMFLGIGAGTANTTGAENSFFGKNAGQSNTSANKNSFFGHNAGKNNTTGSTNSFFGDIAGQNNTTGDGNSFFGSGAGLANTEGFNNVFIGQLTGEFNTTGTRNTFVGRAGGHETSTGSRNTFIGFENGEKNSTGESNTFVGSEAGFVNTTGSNNTLLGKSADLGAEDLTYATAIGSGTVVTVSNTIQLGRDGIDKVRIGDLALAGITPVCLNVNNALATCPNNLVDTTDGQKQVQKIELLQKQVDEQKDLIQRQDALLQKQSAELEALKRLVCANNTEAEVCRSER